MPQCDICEKHAPCVSGPMMVTGMETYACCECTQPDPWTKGEPCDVCADLALETANRLQCPDCDQFPLPGDTCGCGGITGGLDPLKTRKSLTEAEK